MFFFSFIFKLYYNLLKFVACCFSCFCCLWSRLPLPISKQALFVKTKSFLWLLYFAIVFSYSLKLFMWLFSCHPPIASRLEFVLFSILLLFTYPLILPLLFIPQLLLLSSCAINVQTPAVWNRHILYDGFPPPSHRKGCYLLRRTSAITRQESQAPCYPCLLTGLMLRSVDVTPAHGKARRWAQHRADNERVGANGIRERAAKPVQPPTNASQ